MTAIETPIDTREITATGLVDVIAVQRGHGLSATWEIEAHPGEGPRVLAVYPARGMDGFDAIQRYRRERIESQRERHQ